MEASRLRCVAAVLALCCVLVPTSAANAKASINSEKLELYSETDFAGYGMISKTCTVDLPDNVYDSGIQSIADYCTVWNNTVFGGDENIATLDKHVLKYSFKKHNAADHVTTGC
ncbi:nuclear transport factor 2 family protein [Bifidobacterium vespertilionis]|uniref:Uncharacterized protein n=1 Tax=Bifidobacterium vespertilionis TaxID=2562524 RepID=A0A5J5DXR3_9BIFI|nr:hypothetical protein [Bifidobacterium vespertilionis]KAA8821678.1 hypothetical protein EMO90_03370 [Bifidobacterium vespertilionis]KAA8824758.1 hypothetical protein EM848_00665 [Bifidobacterium vespertilionis]